MQILRRAALLGLTVGLVACAYCGWMEYRARIAPDGSDAPMAAALTYDVAARPLSFLTGDMLYDLGFGSSAIANSIQVLANWIILFVIGGALWTLVSRASQRRPNES